MTNGKISKIHKRVNSTAEERLMEKASKVKAPVNTFWDEAEKAYITCIDGIQQTHGLLVEHIQGIMADPEARKKIKDEKGLAENINLLTKDISTHVEQLNAIHEKHKDRTGGTLTPDDHMLVLQINGEYAQVIELYQTVTLPTVAHIFEQTNITSDIIEQQIKDSLEQKQKDLLDPTVISDVIVKE